jgi:hypothetical protein
MNIGDMSVNTYHASRPYYFGKGDAKIRACLMGGLGATSFGEVAYTRANDVAGTISGASKFSTTWRAGAQLYGASRVGGRFGGRWTPTYIKSAPAIGAIRTEAATLSATGVARSR